MSKKRTLDGYFKSSNQSKIAKIEKHEPGLEEAVEIHESQDPPSTHQTYPFLVPQFPKNIADTLGFCPASEGRAINDQPDLDLLYFEPYIPKPIQRDLFNFLRSNLFFYRVRYKIKRGPVETEINTPRFTTVFGVDESSFFGPDGALLDSRTKKPIPSDRYKCQPRPLPRCLDALRAITEGTTGHKFNFCLVNYYASGNDSISYHSDDERFLGPEPAIASLSLGARRDFLMKHKPPPPQGQKGAGPPDPATVAAIENAKNVKLPLGPGDMVLMRGKTQSCWLHSIPKRKGGEADRGRINITFRRALVRGGTENYYQYNVGSGEVYRWHQSGQEMVEWKSDVV